MTVDPDGNWEAGFVSDIATWSELEITQGDMNAFTSISLHVQEPSMIVTPPSDLYTSFFGDPRIMAGNWPVGVEVTLTIDNPGTPAPVDYSDTRITAVEACCGPGGTAFFEPFVGFVLEAGQIVEITGYGRTKAHAITGLEVTEVDGDNDVLWGTADPSEGPVAVYISHEAGEERRDAVFTQDPDGTWIWTADFSVPTEEPPVHCGASGRGTDTFDIELGHQIEVSQWDRVESPERGVTDCDRTAFYVGVPPCRPSPRASPRTGSMALTSCPMQPSRWRSSMT